MAGHRTLLLDKSLLNDDDHRHNYVPYGCIEKKRKVKGKDN